MTTLAFLLAVAAIIGTIIAIESGKGGVQRRPSGLIVWLISGNWPAKIGATLVIVGTGALLRYAAANIDLPQGMKLGAGVAIAAILGFASILTRAAPAQRTLSLTLSGAALGVSYLTTYTAFALYGYLDNVTGLGLLMLTAIAGGVFAVTRSALSLALLAMVGAYLAPAFAVGDPGAYVTYGYYAAASALTLSMVVARGWRPLIHLSFLFSLVGGVFFAWNAKYYTPAHFDVMAPMLLVLVALHVTMPIAERRHTSGAWLERLDLVYLLSLPLVATLLAIAISPSRTGLSMELICLGLIWLLATVYLQIASREGLAAHATIGTLLMGLGVAARFHGLPWDLIALAFAVAAFAAAVYSSQSRKLHNVLAGVVLLLGAVHAITSLEVLRGSVFLNPRFIERLVAAGLLIYASLLCRKVRQTLDSVLLYLGVGWAILTVGTEVIRWNIVSVALILHWLLIAAALAVFAFNTRLKTLQSWKIAVPIGIAGTAHAAAITTPLGLSIFSLIVGTVTMIAFALRAYEPNASTASKVAVIVVPIIAMIWAEHIGEITGIHTGYLPLAAAASGGLLILVTGSLMQQRSSEWLSTAASIFGFAFTIALGYATLLDIERGAWPVGTELLCLAGLVVLALNRYLSTQVVPWIRPAAVCGFALWMQASLLRWLGPDGDLDALSIARMQWPALVSVLWASMGATLTIWSRKSGSRSLWVGGAALLVAAAVKLTLIDMKSLGDLTNILAIMAAGGVFLLVGWLAPMPPAAKPLQPERELELPQADFASSSPTASMHHTSVPAAKASDAAASASGHASAQDASMPESSWKHAARTAYTSRRTDEDDSGRKIAWTIAIVAASALMISRHGLTIVRLLDSSRSKSSEPVAHVLPPVPVPESTPAPIQRTQAIPAPQVGSAEVTIEEAVAPPTTVEQSVPTETPAILENECTRFATQLPDDYEIYVAGAREGHQLDFTVGTSRDISTVFDVQVNLPGRNIVLVLGSSRPAMWTVQGSAQTRIAGVWLTGRGTQEVIGLRSQVPVLKINYAAPGCRNFYPDGGNTEEVRTAIFTALNHQPQAQIVAVDGQIMIGQALPVMKAPQTGQRKVDSTAESARPLPGDQGIEQLVEEGKLKPATLTDYNRWVKKDRRLGSSDTPGGTYLRRTYLVTGPITFPSGLFGAHMATFILLPGVPYPKGDPGHSQVLQGE